MSTTSSFGQPVAVVDIGSNTVKLSVFVCSPNRAPEQVFHVADTVRIGQGTSISGRIADDRVERLIETLQRMETEARQHGAIRLLGVATEAFRRASNGEDVRKLINNHTGWQVDIISGEQETALTLEGAGPFVTPGKSTVIADIGGASTEVIVITRDGSLSSGGSVPLGSGSLFDTHIGDSPPPPNTLDVAFHHSTNVLRKSDQLPQRTEHLLLPGGSGHFLSALAGSLDPAATLDRRGMALIHGWLATKRASVTAQRLDIQVERAQVLPASLTVVEALVELLRPHDVRAIPSGIGLALAIQVCADRYPAAQYP